MSVMSVQLCMEWSLLSTGMSDLYSQNLLTDVRIVCSDGSLMAHKLVLASVSHKLRHLLVTTCLDTNSSPVLLFPDNSLEDIKTIVDIIYFGRQSVPTKRSKILKQMADKYGIQLMVGQPSAQVSHYDQHLSTNSTDSDVCPQLVSRHQNSVPLSDNSIVDRVLDTNSGLFVRPKDEKPLDLSLNESEDNCVLKTIESIFGLNGHKAKTRRRKQLDPKPINRKSVRFNDWNQCFATDSPESSFMDTSDDLPDPSGDFPKETSAEVLAEMDSKVHIPSDSMIGNIDLYSEPNGSTSEEWRDIKPNPKSNKKSGSGVGIKKQSKTDVKCGTDGQKGKDCAICGQRFKTFKQLMNHLNESHKTDDHFLCRMCGKQLKYAKIFAQHLTQCKQSLKN